MTNDQRPVTTNRRLWLALTLALPAASCLGFGDEGKDFRGPDVDILQPAHGDVVAGGVDILVSAFDDVETAVVRIFIDNVLLVEDRQRPFEATWDTRTTTDGAHSIGAEAEDTSGNKSQTSISVLVLNQQNLRGTPP